MDTLESIRKYGAQAVYEAACKQMQYGAGLCAVELTASSMRDVYDIQSAAYAELGDAAKAIDYAKASAALSRLLD